MSDGRIFGFMGSEGDSDLNLSSSVAVFEDYFLHTLKSNAMAVHQAVKVPLSAIVKIDWGSLYHLTVDLMGDGQYRQYPVYGTTEELDRFVAYVLSRRPEVPMNTSRKKDWGPGHKLADKILMTVIALALLIGGTVFFGRLFGWITF